MIDRREMIKLVVIGTMGTALVGGAVGAGVTARPGAASEPVRFSIEGDMGAIRATAGGEAIRLSGDFAGRAVFTLR